MVSSFQVNVGCGAKAGVEGQHAQKALSPEAAAIRAPMQHGLSRLPPGAVQQEPGPSLAAAENCPLNRQQQAAPTGAARQMQMPQRPGSVAARATKAWGR